MGPIRKVVAGDLTERNGWFISSVGLAIILSVCGLGFSGLQFFHFLAEKAIMAEIHEVKGVQAERTENLAEQLRLNRDAIEVVRNNQVMVLQRLSSVESTINLLICDKGNHAK